jgi:acyl-CoA synthetase (AMP-forming)/AMP-acid ligase II
MEKRALAAVCAAGFAFSANYTNHAPMAPALQGEFGFNQAGAGLLTTGIFPTHALTQAPGGRLADRLGAARVLAAALAQLRGPNVFAGYWRRDETTRAASHDGWFKTGDMAERSADG